jgi:hypothetical protein
LNVVAIYSSGVEEFTAREGIVGKIVCIDSSLPTGTTSLANHPMVPYPSLPPTYLLSVILRLIQGTYNNWNILAYIAGVIEVTDVLGVGLAGLLGLGGEHGANL